MILISILILIVAIALPSINRNITPIFFTRIASIIFIYAGVLTFNTFYIQFIESGIGIFNGLFQVTIVTQLLEVFLFVIGSLILIVWPKNINFSSIISNLTREYNLTVQEQKQQSLNTLSTSSKVITISSKVQNILESKNKSLANLSTRAVPRDYSLIVLFSTLGSSLLISSSDLVSMYLSIELQSFGLYILATLYRDSAMLSSNATSAGLKYFLLGGLSSCLILLGAGLIYSFTGLTNFESIYSISSVSDSYNINQGLSLGLIFILVGFLFKISAAPLHNWSPDVYDDSPTIVTIWLTIMAKISIIILLLELYTQIGIIGDAASQTQTLYLSSDGSVFATLSFAQDTLQYLNTISDNINQYISMYPNITSLFSLNESLILPNSDVLDSPASAQSIHTNISETNNNIQFLQTIQSLHNSSLFNITAVAEQYNSLNVIKNLLLISSLLSLIIGTVVGLAQIRIKRLLAYSTISHIGFMLLALAINTEQSIDSLLFYLIQYTITNLNTFLIIIALSYVIIKNIKEPSIITNNKLLNNNSLYGNENTQLGINTKIIDLKYILELKGQFIANPILSLSLTICLFSMAGTPPLIGFFSKQFVLYSAVQSGYYFMAVIAIIVSVISASYYLKIIKILHSEDNLSNANDASVASDTNLAEKEDNISTSLSHADKAGLDTIGYEVFHNNNTKCLADNNAEERAQISNLNNNNKYNLNSNLNNDSMLLDKVNTQYSHLTNYHSYLISVLTLTILLFVLKPSLILNSTQLLSLSLFNF